MLELILFVDEILLSSESSSVQRTIAPIPISDNHSMMNFLCSGDSNATIHIV